MDLAAVILAAGKGTRMKSKLPKVLHKLCGRPMLSYVIDSAAGSGVENTVVVAGFGSDLVASEVGSRAQVVLQQEQLGTAHALMQARPLLHDFHGNVLVLCGDTPLIESSTLSKLVERHTSAGSAATVLTARLNNPAGYGRVIRNEQGGVIKIVEQKDASPEEIIISEINTGIYCFKAAGLFEALEQITPANAQGEYYLTDIIELYVKEGLAVSAVEVANPAEVTGINDRAQLARVEALLRQRVLNDLMLSGVTIIDTASTLIDREVRVGMDTIIYPFTMIEGSTSIGDGCVIGPGARLTGAVIGSSVSIQYSVVIDASIEDRCTIGPYAYLRPGTKLGPGVKIGDFVEIKQSIVGEGSKVPHLSYIGDAHIGKHVNIGAGTITCNYDGQKKWPTRIGDEAFIGSNANLVAPVEVGSRAIIGAGSTISKDVPSGALGVERSKQKVIPDWADKKKS